MLDHVEDIFPGNSGRDVSGCWVRSVPWIGNACGGHCLQASIRFASDCKSDRAKVVLYQSMMLEQPLQYVGAELVSESLLDGDWLRSKPALPHFCATDHCYSQP